MSKLQILRFALVALCGAVASLSVISAKTTNMAVIVLTAVLVLLLVVVLGLYLRVRKNE